jgi:NADPH:quinone reductase-like Zn-dependent oxidoreductase
MRRVLVTRSDERTHRQDRLRSWRTLRSQLRRGTVLPLLISKRVRPILEKSYAMDNGAEALRHLIEDRPFGRVVLSV